MKKMKMKWQKKDKYVVKVNQLKLELGTFGTNNNNINNMFVIQVMGTASQKVKAASFSSSSSIWRSILFPFLHGTRKPGYTHNTTIKRFLSSQEPTTVTWDARDLCGFQLALKDNGSLIGACHMEFHVLHGEDDAGECKPNNMVVAGEVSMDVTMEEITKSNCQLLVHKTLPIQLNVHGLNIKSTLSVSLSIMDLRNFHDYLPRTFENMAELENKQRVIEMVEFDQTTQPNPYESDDSTEFDSDESSSESTTSSSSDSSNGSYYAESRVNANGSIMLPWSRSFKECWRSITAKRKQDTLNSHPSSSMEWENMEVKSRDGNSMLKTNVLFASFDQRSKEASGDSACSALAVFIAHWLLHSNKDLPTRSQFDKLITQGSSEWRRLCKIGSYLKLFPDKHFDLETILEVNLRPLIVLPSESYTGFFAPEKFRCLQGAMSFDEIWDEISRASNEARVYIVSWKDHFFVLKVEEDAYYIIDTLGERLFQGCKRAFMLKFDGSSLMHSKVEKMENENGNEPSKEIVCKGKECCKEFIKLFLAAMPLRQLEEEESKGNVSTTNSYLHRFLQIDVHFCSSSS